MPKGRTTAVLGPSGTGKSVRLENILGLLRPERGEIWVDGEQIVGMRERRPCEVRRKSGVLFQVGALFGSMDPYDNIAFTLREHSHENERQIREIVLRNAELVGPVDHLKKLEGPIGMDEMADGDDRPFRSPRPPEAGEVTATGGPGTSRRHRTGQPHESRPTAELPVANGRVAGHHTADGPRPMG